MTLELKEPTLIKRIEQLASATHQPSEQLLETAVQKYLDELEREAIHRATEIFWGMYDDLVKQYPQEHVAMREGHVVDHDQNASLLEMRVREKFGVLPVLIAPVTSKPVRELRWRGGRIEGLGSND